MFPTKFQLIWSNGFKEDFFLIGQSQTRIAYGSHISFMIGMKYGHFVQDLPYIVTTRLQFIKPPSFRGEDFQPIRNKNCPWRPYFFTNEDEMRKSYKGPSVDVSCNCKICFIWQSTV